MRLGFDRRLSRILAAIVVVLLGVGAFLARGPIGLGNGPLFFESFSISGWPDLHHVPVGLIVPIINRGRSPAVINGVTLVGGGNGYPAPRLITVYAADNSGCAAVGPLAGPGSLAFGRCATGRLALRGLAIPPSRTVTDQVTGRQVAVPSLGLVAEAAPPAAGKCWTLRAMAIHYRVGIRHYTATAPEAGAVCGSGVSGRDLRDAMISIGGQPGQPGA
jgi:hypothetical protein